MVIDERPLRRGLQLQGALPVLLADVPGRGHHVHPGPPRQAAQPGRVAAQLDGARLDQRPAAGQDKGLQLGRGPLLVVQHQVQFAAHLFAGRAGQQVLVPIGRPELLRGDVTHHGTDQSLHRATSLEPSHFGMVSGRATVREP